MFPQLPETGPSGRNKTAAASARALPVAQPQYILRGHSSQVHAVAFLRANARLLTGDADGWVVLWRVAARRPVAVWRAHQGPILGLCGWPPDRIVTHGRDGSLNVWQLKQEEESAFSTLLPADGASAHRRPPWLLHSLAVNTLNFCSFASYLPPPPGPDAGPSALRQDAPCLHLAVPGRAVATVQVHRLPQEELVATIGPPDVGETGMVMAVHFASSTGLLVGYESGHICIFEGWGSRQPRQVYASRPHAQPVLSLCSRPGDPARGPASNPHLLHVYSSAADDIIAVNVFLPRMNLPPDHAPSNVPARAFAEAHGILDGPYGVCTPIHTKHSGQQGLTVRDDGSIFATAGWDGRVRVYAADETARELAVLAWHKEGCYAVAFASTLVSNEEEEEGEEDGELGAGRQTIKSGGTRRARAEAQGAAAGTSSSSGRRSGSVEPAPLPQSAGETAEERQAEVAATFAAADEKRQLVGNEPLAPRPRRRAAAGARRRREGAARAAHWIAVGSKDGKVSLWDIY